MGRLRAGVSAPRPAVPVDRGAQRLGAGDKARAGAVQQVGVDGDQRPVRHRRQRRPLLPVVEPGRRRAPRGAGDDHVGSRGQHRLDADDRCGQRQRREHVLAAAGPHGLRHEVASAQRVQRRVPDLVEHPHRRTGTAPCDQVLPALAQRARGRDRDVARSRQRPEPFELVGDRRRRRRVGHEQGDAARRERGRLRRRRVGPADDEVGLQRDDALEVERARVADGGQRARRGGEIGGRDDTDDVVARTGREQQLGRVGREADDAARGGGQRHRVAGAVADGDRSPCRRARRGNRGHRRVRIRLDRADRGCHSDRRQREQDQHDEGASGVHGCQRSPA